MAYTVCPKCGTALRVVGSDQEVSGVVGRGSKWFPSGYLCERCGCSSCTWYEEGREPEGTVIHNIRQLTVPEMLAFQFGLGFPEERSCTVDAVSDAIVGKTVTSVGLSDRNGRVCLDWIESDGVRLFLASGSHGPVVYRIRRNSSYVAGADDVGS